MRLLFVSLISTLIPTVTLAAEKLSCTHYVYPGMPFITVTMTLTADGHVERLGDVTHYGSTRQTAIEENPASGDQLYNLTIEADSPEGELFLEIYKPSDTLLNETFKAKLINPQSPAMKEMAGECSLGTQEQLKGQSL